MEEGDPADEQQRACVRARVRACVRACVRKELSRGWKKEIEQMNNTVMTEISNLRKSIMGFSGSASMIDWLRLLS